MIRDRFDEWTRQLDGPALYAGSNLRAWLAAAPILLLGVALGAWIPVTSPIIQLDPTIPLAVLALHIPIVVAGNLFGTVDRSIAPHGWGLACLGTINLQLFMASLIACSGPRGQPIFIGLLLFMIAVHAFTLPIKPRHPFMAIGSMIACAMAALVHPSHANLATFGILAAVSGLVALTAGGVGDSTAHNREKTAQLQEASTARMLEDKALEIRALDEKLLDLLGANHDINNALGSSIINAELLALGLRSQTPIPTADAIVMVDAIVQSGRSVLAIVSEARARFRGATSPTSEDRIRVALDPVVKMAHRTIVARFPVEQLVTNVEPGLSVVVRGGDTMLPRIFENLLLNALQGDGTRAANRIELTARRDGERVRITIIDNGPGFPPRMLEPGRPELFKTTKRDGTGVGLATVDLLVRACGGEMWRSNEPGSGARVDVLRWRPHDDVPTAHVA